MNTLRTRHLSLKFSTWVEQVESNWSENFCYSNSKEHVIMSDYIRMVYHCKLEQRENQKIRASILFQLNNAGNNQRKSKQLNLKNKQNNRFSTPVATEPETSWISRILNFVAPLGVPATQQPLLPWKLISAQLCVPLEQAGRNFIFIGVLSAPCFI